MKILTGGSENVYTVLQNQHMTSSYRSDGFQLNNLMTCATQLTDITNVVSVIIIWLVFVADITRALIG